MLNIIKNSFNVVLKNYTIPLFFVLFLTLITFTASKFGSMPTILALCTLSVLIVFVGAFFAGWYGMIKSAVLYSYQEKTKEEELKDIFSLKNEFLNYVGSHILPLFLGFVLYGILALIFFNSMSFLAEKLIGNIDFLYDETKNIINSTSALANYIQALPKEKLIIIFGWQIFMFVSISLFNLFTF